MPRTTPCNRNTWKITYLRTFFARFLSYRACRPPEYEDSYGLGVAQYLLSHHYFRHLGWLSWRLVLPATRGRIARPRTLDRDRQRPQERESSDFVSLQAQPSPQETQPLCKPGNREDGSL